MLPEAEKITFEEFMTIDRSEKRLEYINGQIYYQASPSVEHQHIITELCIELGIYFRGKTCSPFVAPLDVIMQNDNEKHLVQPDLFIICDKRGLNENNYSGVPTIIIEVLSPSTSSRDMITKMDLYMRFGVKEYWVVSPKNQCVQQFVLEDGSYTEPNMYFKDDTLESTIFTDLFIYLGNVF